MLGIGKLPSSSLMARRLGSVRHVVCTSPGYLAVHGTPQIGYQITLSATMSCLHAAFGLSRAPTPTGDPCPHGATISNPEAARDAAQAGVALAAGALVTILDEFRPPALPVHVIYTAGRFLPIKVRAFLDFAAPRLKARLDE